VILKYEYDLIMTMKAIAATIALPHLQKVANRDIDRALERLRIPKFSFEWHWRTGMVKLISPEKKAANAGPR
jgi:hypothetical protein